MECRRILSCFMLMLLVTVLPADETTIALHPFKGGPEDIAKSFFDVLFYTVMDDPASYTVYSITLKDHTADIPDGGFPANICPSPSITAGASYVITGEVDWDPDYLNSYRLRLYLWGMDDSRLLAIDEMTAAGRESCEALMPNLLAWLLSWIGTDKPAQVEPIMIVQEPIMIVQESVRISEERPVTASWDSTRWIYIGPKGSGERSTAVENPEQWVYMGPEREQWLHLGLRAGMGSSQWYYNLDNNKAKGIINFWNASVALQAAVHIVRFLDIQTEVNVAADFGTVGIDSPGGMEEGGVAASWSMTVPLLVRLNLRGSHLKAGIFAGPYLYLPLGTSNGDSLGDYLDYRPNQPGVTFGLNLGWRVGPGNLFLDGRFDYDGKWFSDDKELAYYRNSVKISTGYEFGFINKK